MRIVVSNSSPLILLAKIRLFGILEALFERIEIPEAVYHEVVTKGKGKPGAKEVDEANWITVQSPDMSMINQSYQDIFGKADASVMALAKERNASLVIVDDDELREIMEREGLQVTGTAGIFIRAKEEGLIPSVKKALDRAIENGLRISDEVIKDILKEAGE